MVRAKWKMVVSLILFMVSPGDGLFHAVYRSILVSQSFKGDAGQPLFLSPYIKNGKIKEGKCCTGNCCYLLKFVLFHFTALYSMVF
jgi:vitellogenic carboxypeptidase-like protein